MQKTIVEESNSSKPSLDENSIQPTSLQQYCENVKAWKYQHDLSAWHVYVNHLKFYNQGIMGNPGYKTSTTTVQASEPTLSQVNINAAFSQAAIKLPTLKCRVLAEIIDAVILTFIKFVIVWFLFSSYELLYPDFAVNLLLDSDGEEFFFEYDGSQLYQMMLFALLYRVFVWFYEFYGIYAFGCTIGKKLLGIRVVQCTSIMRNNNNSITIMLGNRGGKVAWKYSCIRSALKNISIAFLIPSSFTVFFNAYKRTSYDIASNTIAIKI